MMRTFVVHLIRHAAPHALEDVQTSLLHAQSIVSSPLRRALRTAELLFPDREITVVNELAEIAMGEWEGKPWEHIEAAWPELARRKMEDWTAITPPGGEPWPTFTARVTAGWMRVSTLPGPVAVVAHAGVNSVLAHLIAGTNPLEFSQSYEEVITFEAVSNPERG